MATSLRVKPTDIYHKDGSGPVDSERLLNYTCPVCECILVDPVQASCGDRFCKGCPTDKQTDKPPPCFECPRCHEEVKTEDFFPDRGCRREINGLYTKCRCEKLISMGKYEMHVKEECACYEVTCVYGCGATYLMSEKTAHFEECPNRTVSCSYCTDEIKQCLLQEHYEICALYPNKCPYCSEEFDSKNEVGDHLNVDCEKKKHSCVCGQKILKKEVQEHHNPEHSFLLSKYTVHHAGILEQLFGRIETLERDKVNSSRLLKDTIEKQNQTIEAQSSKITELKDTLKKMKENQEIKMSALEENLKLVKQELVDSKVPALDEYETDCPKFAGLQKSFHSGGNGSMPSFGQTRSPHSSMETHGTIAVASGLEKTFEQKIKSTEDDFTYRLKTFKEDMLHKTTQQETGLEYIKNEIEKIFKLLQAQDDNIMRQKTILEDVHLRQELLEVKATRGVFIWKINELNRRKQDANEARVLSLYSPPFFTSFHGYRMCIRCYLNGDGSGKGSHISVFFVIMKSEHDDLLPWPFKQKVTISLLNQSSPTESGTHVTQSFMPDSKSSSFQKPTKDMNIASGFPKFAPRDVLAEKKYTANDTLYFKVKVDLGDIPLD